MPGEKTTLSAEIIPSDTTDSKTISWKSNKLSVASVNGNGVVYAKNPGTATITATAGNISKSIDITVKGEEIAVTSVSLNKTSTTIEVGGSETLTATINPTTATNKTLTWKSSDTNMEK